MNLVGITRAGLIDYVSDQLAHFFPDRAGDARAPIASAFDDALDRLRPCVQLNRVWPEGGFRYLHSNQYATFLYLLANTLWKRGGAEHVCDKLYGLNKALNGLECFYTIELPRIFSICHSPGIVLAQATYADYLVLYQGVTVGRIDPASRPVLSEGVILFPHSAIIGACRVGPRTVVSLGHAVIDADTPGDCVVFSDRGELVFKPSKTDYLARFFRLDAR